MSTSSQSPADPLDGLRSTVRVATLNEAIAIARHEYLTDDTGTDEDRAYNQGVTDVIAAIGALLEGGAR